jgi:predicted ATPase
VYLTSVITRCLEKDPDRRFTSAADVASALRHGARPTLATGPILKPPPAPSTALLGREALLDAATARIAAGARLLTITGYGGTGKTRFSIALYQRLAPSYLGGAAFVSIAAVTDAREVMTTVATTLDLGEAHGRTSIEALIAVIADQRMLLVLDNLEQVLDAAGEIATLVSRCPALQVVATSRAPLKVGPETEFALPPLELPALDDRALEAIASCPSIALFVQRAEKVKPGFALSAGNVSAIAAICRQLDGLPLALELAAARVRILEPAVLLQRLDRALDLLTTGDRDLPLRQRTLRTTISWSYSLLTPSEQRLLRGLSVFREGWTLEAMEQVCYAPGEAGPALDELASLVEKSLVRVVGGGERYALLETVRAFASEQLHASAETDALDDAHAQYFVTAALEIHASLFGPRQLDAMRRGRTDLANLHAALQWLTTRARAGDPEAREQALLLSGGMDWYWHITGLHLTAREWLDAVLTLAEGATPSRGRALARLAAGMVSTTTGEWDRSLAEWSGAFEDGVAIGDAPAAAEGRMGVGYCLLSTGRMEEAAVAIDDAIARSTGVTDFILGMATALKGMLRFATGHLDEGMTIMEEAIRIEARISDHEIRGVATSFLAQMTFSKGDHARALELYREALALLETVGDLPEIARVHSEIGWTALAGSDTREARKAFLNAVRTNEMVGSPRGTGLALLGLAAVEATEGRAARAIEIAAVADAFTKRTGVVITHPMAPGFAERIDALKASIPRGELDGIVAAASALTPAAVLARL